MSNNINKKNKVQYLFLKNCKKIAPKLIQSTKIKDHEIAIKTHLKYIGWGFIICFIIWNLVNVSSIEEETLTTIQDDLILDNSKEIPSEKTSTEVKKTHVEEKKEKILNSSNRWNIDIEELKRNNEPWNRSLKDVTGRAWFKWEKNRKLNPEEILQIQQELKTKYAELLRKKFEEEFDYVEEKISDEILEKIPGKAEVGKESNIYFDKNVKIEHKDISSLIKQEINESSFDPNEYKQEINEPSFNPKNLK